MQLDTNLSWEKCYFTINRKLLVVIVLLQHIKYGTDRALVPTQGW